MTPSPLSRLRLRLSPRLVGILLASSVVCGGTCFAQLRHASGNGIRAMGYRGDAVVSVVIVNSSGGSNPAQATFTSSQTGAIETAIENLAAAPGSNVDSTTTVTTSMPNLGSGTASNPISVVYIGTQNQINALMADGSCAGRPACTSYNFDGNGNTTSSTTIMLQTTADSSDLEQGQSHEFGHPGMGALDCSGCDSIMNPDVTSGSPTAPTDLDDDFIIDEQGGGGGGFQPCDTDNCPVQG